MRSWKYLVALGREVRDRGIFSGGFVEEGSFVQRRRGLVRAAKRPEPNRSKTATARNERGLYEPYRLGWSVGLVNEYWGELKLDQTFRSSSGGMTE